MELVSLFDDFCSASNCCGPHHCSKRPCPSFLDSLEDRFDQQVGYVLRNNVPTLLMDINDIIAPIKRKRIMDGRLARKTEPKCKATVSTNNGKFQVALDTSNFSPDSITVKVVGDKIGVSAKHESKKEDTYEYHEMYRSFSIPQEVDPDAIVSRLNSTGQLTIEAPMKAVKDSPVKRNVPIERENEKSDLKEK